MYGSVTELITKIAGMGIPTSGVRQVAEANGLGDRRKIRQTITTLRYASLVLGTLGAGALFSLCVPMSQLTFGDNSHANSFAILSVCIIFTSVSAGQTALIQGMRRIRDLATLRIAGAICGLVVSIPFVWVLGERGVAPSMAATAAALMCTSYWFARRVPVDHIVLTWREILTESKGLIGLGVAFMFAGLMTTSSIYFIRMSIIHKLGLDAVGHYQAAFALSGSYVGIILGAMGADFYPRLTASASDSEACNRLVNEQSEVGLLIAGPGIVATLTLAPLVIRLLYSVEFMPAVDVLRWQILGDLGRIVSWPLGFVILAKGKGIVFVVTELFSSIVHVLLIVYAINKWGLPGTGIAYCTLYIIYCCFIRFIVGHISGFRWTSHYFRLFGLYSAAILSAFAAPFFMGPYYALGFGCVITSLMTLYSCWSLYRLIGTTSFWQLLDAIPIKFVSKRVKKEVRKRVEE